MKLKQVKKSSHNFVMSSMVLLLSTLSASCSNSGGGGSNSGDNNEGDVSTLQIIAPKIIYSLLSESGISYVAINNPTGTAIKNIHYSLSNSVGSGTDAKIDPVSAEACAIVGPNSHCNLKIIIPAGAVAGSIGVIANNGDVNLLSKLSKSLRIDINNIGYSGIEEAAYNNLSGADGITLGYYHTVINGTPYIMVSGLVASGNAGNFNNVVLVDGNNNPIPNQQLIGSTNGYKRGSTFNILLPVTSGNNASQTIKVQTRQILNGKATVVSTTTASSTLTKTQGVGIIEILPSTIYLSKANPEQTITLLNIGDTVAQLQQLASNSPNVEVTFNPTSLNRGTITTAKLKLKDTSVAATSGNVILGYNNGQNSTVSSGTVEQNLDPAPTPVPTPVPTPTPAPAIAGLIAVFSPDNDFFTTTAIGTVSRQMTITNTGNTTENGIVLTLPANFSISNGTSNSCTVTQGTSPATISNNLLAGTGSCNVTVTYANTTAVAQSIDNIIFAYDYNNSTAATTLVVVNYKVTQSTANLNIIPASYDFGSIVGNNTQSSGNILFTITNSGDIATNGSSFSTSVAGTNSSMFSTNTIGITTSEHCGNSLAAGSNCKINVKFGPTTTVVNPVTATLNANYVPYSGQNSIAATSSLSGISVASTAASINISVPSASGFSGNGTSDTPYVVNTNANATLTYSFTNTGTESATNFYVTNNSLPDGWTRSGGTCASISGTNLPNTGSNSCTVIYTINSTILGLDNFNQDVMTANWIDQANPGGIIQPIESKETYVMVQAPPAITIVSTTDWGQIMMGNTYSFTATITGGISTVTPIVAGIADNTVSPASCTLDSGGISSCTFIVTGNYSLWSPGIIANSTDVDNPTVFYTNSGVNLNVTADRGATINGNASPQTFNNIIGTVAAPYVYLAAPIEGAKSATNTGITWGAGGTVINRFVVGKDSSGNPCASGEEIESDTLTGLTWVQAPTSTTYNWEDAQTKQSSGGAIPDSYCGYSDWRLPTVNELVSLINYGAIQSGSSPAAWLNSHGFNNVISDVYWSSTPYDNSSSWNAQFGTSISSYENNFSTFYVWPVRDVH